MMSFWCFYFAPILHIFSGVSTVDFEYVFVCRFTGIKWMHEKKNQPAITCTKLTLETLEQGVQYVQS